jgi:hypothetical protein
MIGTPELLFQETPIVRTTYSIGVYALLLTKLTIMFGKTRKNNGE